MSPRSKWSYDQEIWTEIKEKWKSRFNITEDSLHLIYTFCFGRDLEDDGPEFLNLHSKDFKRIEYEIIKAIARTKPKLNELPTLQQLREKYRWEIDQKMEGEDMSFANVKVDGKWTQKF